MQTYALKIPGLTLLMDVASEQCLELLFSHPDSFPLKMWRGWAPPRGTDPQSREAEMCFCGAVRRSVTCPAELWSYEHLGSRAPPCPQSLLLPHCPPSINKRASEGGLGREGQGEKLQSGSETVQESLCFHVSHVGCVLP